MKYLQTLLIFLLAASAHGYDKMTLKNGKVVECYVLELSGGRFKIQNSNGEVIEGSASFVESIAFEAHARKDNVDAGQITEASAIKFTGSLGPAGETPVQKAELARFAGEVFQRPIRSIAFFRSGALVHFERVQIEGAYYESACGVIQHKDLPPNRPPKDKEGNVLWGPQENDAVSGPWFTDRKVEKKLVVRYALKGAEIFLGAPDRLGSHDMYHNLLLSIEAENFKVAEELIERHPPAGKEGFPGINVEKIIEIETTEMEGKPLYNVRTSWESRSSGDLFIFERRDSGFRLISIGGWRMTD
jgi:hypothetical protein